MKALVSPLFSGPEVAFSNWSGCQCGMFDSLFGDKMDTYKTRQRGAISSYSVLNSLQVGSLTTINGSLAGVSTNHETSSNKMIFITMLAGA